MEEELFSHKNWKTKISENLRGTSQEIASWEKNQVISKFIDYVATDIEKPHLWISKALSIKLLFDFNSLVLSHHASIFNASTLIPI